MTRAEFDALRDGDHVELECGNHPHQKYSCKKVAVNVGENNVGTYNGCRSVFYLGIDPPCTCSVDSLRLVLER